MRILAIESSCDESSVAVLNDKYKKLNVELHVVNSQIKEHQKYGGVIPELAARLHVENIVRIFDKIKKKINFNKIDYVAVTAGPGLITSLLVGAETAKVLAYLLDKPLILVNHLTAHINSVFLDKKIKDIQFPAIALLVSGGHTELVYMKHIGEYKVLGRTRDDAVGEAYDKVAKILNLSYPGGPVIARRAQFIKEDLFNFPRPMLKSNDLDFSFSGLKTAVLYKRQEYKRLTKKIVDNIAYSFQEAVIDVLTFKMKKALKKYKNVKSIFVVGGVSANERLREVFNQEFAENYQLYFPKLEYCGDNAAMVSADAYLKVYLKDKKYILSGASQISAFRPNPNWAINKSLWRH